MDWVALIIMLKSVHMQENKEKALSEYASLTLIPWACKTYSLGYNRER